VTTALRVRPDGDADWALPGVFEVATGVYRIPLPLPNDGLRAVNVYALRAGDDLVLVDSGWAVDGAREGLRQALDALGKAFTDVRRFLVTHVHRDHYTQAIQLRREFGTPVALGVGELPAIRAAQDPARVPLQHQLMQLRRGGGRALADRLSTLGGLEDVNAKDFEPPDTWFHPGDVIPVDGRLLAVVPTPGHTRGHVVFHDVDGELLFAGDHVLPTITPSIGFEPVFSTDPLGDYLRSLALVRARPDALLLPAHGPTAPSAHRRIDELVAHHGARLEKTETAVTSGADTAFDVAGRLRWTRRERLLSELDPFNQMLAVCETVAHLDLLVAQGRLAVSLEDGVQRYGPPTAWAR
jgi:glyoxylase-like metal-dependent hydrolase (beta-lactamase superfamily II)